MSNAVHIISIEMSDICNSPVTGGDRMSGSMILVGHLGDKDDPGHPNNVFEFGNKDV